MIYTLQQISLSVQVFLLGFEEIAWDCLTEMLLSRPVSKVKGSATESIVMVAASEKWNFSVSTLVAKKAIGPAIALMNRLASSTR